jgi:hypothetical protein
MNPWKRKPATNRSIYFSGNHQFYKEGDMKAEVKKPEGNLVMTTYSDIITETFSAWKMKINNRKGRCWENWKKKWAPGIICLFPGK